MDRNNWDKYVLATLAEAKCHLIHNHVQHIFALDSPVDGVYYYITNDANFIELWIKIIVDYLKTSDKLARDLVIRKLRECIAKIESMN